MPICSGAVAMTSIASIFLQAYNCVSVGWAQLVIGAVIIAGMMLLVQTRIGLAASLLIFNVLAFAFFTVGYPFTGLFWACITADAIVIVLAILRVFQ